MYGIYMITMETYYLIDLYKRKTIFKKLINDILYDENDYTGNDIRELKRRLG